MRMREYAFSTAAWEKLVYERSSGVASLQVYRQEATRCSPRS